MKTEFTQAVMEVLEHAASYKAVKEDYWKDRPEYASLADSIEERYSDPKPTELEESLYPLLDEDFRNVLVIEFLERDPDRSLDEAEFMADHYLGWQKDREIAVRYVLQYAHILGGVLDNPRTRGIIQENLAPGVLLPERTNVQIFEIGGS